MNEEFKFRLGRLTAVMCWFVDKTERLQNVDAKFTIATLSICIAAIGLSIRIADTEDLSFIGWKLTWLVLILISITGVILLLRIPVKARVIDSLRQEIDKRPWLRIPFALACRSCTVELWLMNNCRNANYRWLCETLQENEGRCKEARPQPRSRT